MENVDNAANVTDNATLCLGGVYVEKQFVNISVGPALLVVILISFFTKRKSLWPSCCWGRPGVAYPINFIDEHERRWAYAAAFGIVTYKVMLLFDGLYFYKPEEFDDPLWMKKYGFVTVFVKMINVLQLSVVYYPLFACVAYRRNIIANILGFVYTGIWIGISLFSILVCLWQNLTVEFFATENQIILNIVFYVPVCLCYLVLLVAFVMDFVINLRTKRINNTDIIEDQALVHDTLSQLYVRNLFLRESRRAPKKLVAKLKHNCRYINVPGLKYSPRVLCTMVVAAFALIKSGIEVAFWLDVLISGLERYVGLVGKPLLGLVENNSTDVIFEQIVEGLLITRVTLAVCNAVSLAVHIVFMGLMVVSYRNHVRKYILGDREWHYRCKQSPASLLVGSMRYAGYQIAFLIYGWIILFSFIFLILMLLIFLIILPLRDGYTTFAIEKIKELWPTLIISFAILMFQKLLAKFVFLQDNGAHLSLTNIRWYHVTSFFLFFFNILLGLFSALKRILISMVAGILFLGRLDRVLMMKGVESFDSGFSSYLGMIQTDVYHTHPILKFFVECLTDAVRTRKRDFDQATDDEDLEMRKTRHRRRVLANKWFKAITLINNPTILVERLNRLITEQREQEDNQTEFVLLDAMKQAQTLVEKPLDVSRDLSFAGGTGSASENGKLHVNSFTNIGNEKVEYKERKHIHYVENEINDTWSSNM